MTAPRVIDITTAEPFPHTIEEIMARFEAAGGVNAGDIVKLPAGYRKILSIHSIHSGLDGTFEAIYTRPFLTAEEAASATEPDDGSLMRSNGSTDMAGFKSPTPEDEARELYATLTFARLAQGRITSILDELVLVLNGCVTEGLMVNYGVIGVKFTKDGWLRNPVTISRELVQEIVHMPATETAEVQA